jgi:hypothetical protein
MQITISAYGNGNNVTIVGDESQLQEMIDNTNKVLSGIKVPRDDTKTAFPR